MNGTSVTSSGTGSGAGAGFGAGFAFCAGFFFPRRAASTPPKQHTPRRPHSQFCMLEPDEPDNFHPQLASEPDESPMQEPSPIESETKESLEVPLLPEEESHGVTVVVVAGRVIHMVTEVCAWATPSIIARATARIAIMVAVELKCLTT